MLYRFEPKEDPDYCSSGLGFESIPVGVVIDIDPSHIWHNKNYDYDCVTFKNGKSVKVTDSIYSPWVRFDYMVPADYREVFDAL